MTDNLKTWPERIFISYELTLVSSHIELPAYDPDIATDHWYEIPSGVGDVKYIRADIAEKDKQELRDVINGLVELCELLGVKFTAKEIEK